MSYAVYLRKKMKNLPVTIGPDSGREASEITQLNALRANKVKSDTNNTEPLGNGAQSIAVVQSFTTAQDYGLGAGLTKDTYSFSTIVYKGGFTNQSGEAITLKNAASVIPDDRSLQTATSITIPCTSNYTVFDLRSINNLLAWFDASDATTMFSDNLNVSYPVATNDAFGGGSLPTPTTRSAVSARVNFWYDKTGRFFATPPGNSNIYNTVGLLATRTTDNGVRLNGYELGIYPTIYGSAQGIPITNIASQGVSVFMVTGVDQETTTQNVLLDRQLNRDDDFGPTFLNTRGSVVYRHDTYIGSNPELPLTPGSEYFQIPGSLTNRAMLHFDRNSNNANIFVNGNTMASLPSAADADTSLRYTTFGRRVGDGQTVYANAQTTGLSNTVAFTNLTTGTRYTMYEVIIVDRTITTSERQIIEGYLAQKWGFTLPANHPYYWKPVLTQDLPVFLPDAPCKPGYCPGIKYTGPQQFDPFRGGTRPVFARNKVWTPSGLGLPANQRNPGNMGYPNDNTPFP